MEALTQPPTYSLIFYGLEKASLSKTSPHREQVRRANAKKDGQIWRRLDNRGVERDGGRCSGSGGSSREWYKLVYSSWKSLQSLWGKRGSRRDACGKNHSQHSNWILMLSWKCLREPATLWLPDTEVVVFLPFSSIFKQTGDAKRKKGTSAHLIQSQVHTNHDGP